MSVHQPYPPQFNQFRMASAPSIYTGANVVPPYRPVGVSAAYGLPGGRMAPSRRDQNGNTSFYSGYTYYLSPYQHPVIVHQAGAAANNWFLDAVGKMPWHQIIPSWTEMLRMGVRSGQDQVTARLSKWRSKRPGGQPLRGAAKQALQGLRHWA